MEEKNAIDELIILVSKGLNSVSSNTQIDKENKIIITMSKIKKKNRSVNKIIKRKILKKLIIKKLVASNKIKLSKKIINVVVSIMG